jgi:hypothetical protein
LLSPFYVRSILSPYPLWVYIVRVKTPPKLELTPEQRKIAAELGRIGGQTRAKKLTPERRRAIARQASKAAAEARKKKAAERKRST